MPGMYGSFALPVPEAEQVNLYPLTHALNATDATSLATINDPLVGDIAVIDTKDGETVVQKTAYQYTGVESQGIDGWVALNGEVRAENVVLTEDITLAGNYTQVGNLTKTQTGTTQFSTKGKTLAEVLNEIFYKVVQPTIVREPSLGPVEISQTGSVEVGSTLSGVDVAAADFDAGEYSFGPATGVTPTYTVTRVTGEGSTVLSGVGADGSVTDTSFAIGDTTGEAYYKVTANYTEGAVANDNIGEASNPAVKIAAGTVEAVSEKITAYRKYFTGSSSNGNAELTNAFIRNLTGSTGAFTGEAEVAVADDAKLVVIAYPATLGDLTEIIDTGAMNANIISAFEKTTVQVEGANGYTATAYNVYSYRPAKALQASTYVAKV